MVNDAVKVYSPLYFLKYIYSYHWLCSSFCSNLLSIKQQWSRRVNLILLLQHLFPNFSYKLSFNGNVLFLCQLVLSVGFFFLFEFYNGGDPYTSSNIKPFVCKVFGYLNLVTCQWLTICVSEKQISVIWIPIIHPWLFKQIDIWKYP